MMNRRSLFLLTAMLSISIGFNSCAKKESANTPSDRLIGKWKKVKFATDDNNNGQIDSWEISAVQPNIVNTVEFKKDNTGVEKTSGAFDLDFTWEIVGELSLQVIYSANDTIRYNLIDVNSSALNLTTRTSISLAGYYYDRQ
jgi:hypothetical protein